jgi:hypothetical protein
MASSISNRGFRRARVRTVAPLALFIAAILMSGAAAIAGFTRLATLSFSPDIPVRLGVTYVDPAVVGAYNVASNAISITSFPGLPPGIHITGYAAFSTNQTLLTLNAAASLPIDNKGDTVKVTARDVVPFNNTTKFFGPLVFLGRASGVPAGTDIDAFTTDPANKDFVFSFDTTITLGGAASTKLTVRPADLVEFNGLVYSMLFNASTAGVPAGLNLDAAAILPNDHFLLAFNAPGTIGDVNFGANDVLEYDPAHKVWSLAYKGAGHGWPDGSDIQALSAQVAPASTPTPTRTATPTPTRLPTRTATAAPTHTPVLTRTIARTPTPAPTHTPLRTPTRTPTAIPTRTHTAAPTHTALRTPTRTATPAPTHTPSKTPTLTPTRTATPTPIRM